MRRLRVWVKHNGQAPTYQLLLEGNLLQLHRVDGSLRCAEQRHRCGDERNLHLGFEFRPVAVLDALVTSETREGNSGKQEVVSC